MALMTVQRSLALNTLHALQDAGFTAYFAGGCVRDQLLKINPKDYDLATNATPESIEELFPNAREVGRAFGVMLVPHAEYRDIVVEVATFRSDGSYSDGRHPDSVAFGDAEADAQRRDFTINGLFYDPVADKIIDYVGGQKDIKACKIRAIRDPRERFSEDHLRLLRAVRFAARLTFEIVSETWQAVKEMASKVSTVSGERIFKELDSMMAHNGRGRAVGMLLESGLMAQTLPEVDALWDQSAGAHSALERNLSVLDMLGDQGDVRDAWLALFLGVGRAGVDSASQRLRFSSDLKVFLGGALELIGEVDLLESSRTADVKRRLRQPWAEGALRIAALASLRAESSPAAHWRSQLARWQSEGKESLFPKVPLDGKDLQQLGVVAGPRVGALLRDLESECLEGRCRTSAEAKAFIQTRLRGEA